MISLEVFLLLVMKSDMVFEWRDDNDGDMVSNDVTYVGEWHIWESDMVSICCGNQTPSWFPSSPKGEIVGNMMQSVVLDGNPLDEDEDMWLLTCVVLDGKPPDEVILDLMDLVNDVNLM